jgi:serine/threonine protein kinase
LFIASDAVDIHSQLQLVDADSCPGFDRWFQMKRSGIVIDFRRIQRVGFDLPCLKDYLVDLSAFKETRIICHLDTVRNQIYHRIEDELLVCMKSKPHWENIEASQIENEIKNEIEKLINLRHPCIAAPIGFVFRIESDSRQELNIVQMYFESCSLADVLRINPAWWTSTMKAKMIASLVLGLRFVHSLGLIHGHLTSNDILLNSDDYIQIIDFDPIVFKVSESKEVTRLEGFSEEGWTLKNDIEAFVSILSEVVVGSLPQNESSIPTGIPDFVSRIIKSKFSPVSSTRYSFNTILEILKQNKFEIEDGVDSAEVFRFVSWVESIEHV